MELTDAIAKFKADLSSVKAGGQTQVEIQKLEAYLDDLQAQAGISAEQQRQAHERALAQHSAVNSFNMEMFKSVMAAGKEAINAAIIINGGAVIALMAFMGNTVGKSGTNYLSLLAFPVFLLGLGVLCGGVAFATRYIAQFCYGYNQMGWTRVLGHIINAITWLITAASFLVFACAILDCYHSLSTAVLPIPAAPQAPMHPPASNIPH